MPSSTQISPVDSTFEHRAFVAELLLMLLVAAEEYANSGKAVSFGCPNDVKSVRGSMGGASVTTMSRQNDVRTLGDGSPRAFPRRNNEEPRRSAPYMFIFLFLERTESKRNTMVTFRTEKNAAEAMDIEGDGS